MALLDKINYLTLPNKISVQTSSQSAAGVQNWKDGSSSGSVRTSGSSVQDTEYKIGQYAVTEGSNTKAQGQAAHAEGTQSTANGASSHAEGYYTQANGTSSHAEGMGTKSTHAYQHVFGTYNKLDSSSNSSNQKGTYIEIVGNGTSDNLTNARTLDWQGNETLSGKLTVGIAGTNPMDVATVSQLSDTKVTQSDLPASNANYRVLLSAHANNTTETDKVWKNEGLIYNPTGGILIVGDSNGNHTSIDSTEIAMFNSNEGSGGSIISKGTIDKWNTADTKVAQNNSTSANDYRVLLSNTASNSDETATTYKSANLRFMPSDSHLYVGSAGKDALITVSPRMHLGVFNQYGQDGSTSSEKSYGLGMGIDNGLAYNSYFTISMLSFQHWNSSRPSGGTPSSTNYVQTEAYLNSNNLAVRRYSGKDTLSTSATLSDTLLTFVTTAGNSYTVGPTKISHWDQVYNWFQPIQEIYQDNGITMEGTKGERYFTYSSHSIVASQLGTRVNTVKPQGFTITAYQNGGVVSFNMVFQIETAITNPTALFAFTPKYQPANALQCVIVKYANKRYTRPEALGAYVSSSENAIMANNLQTNTSYRISGTYMLK